MPEGDSSDTTKRRIITVQMATEDLPRLQRAFAEGRLAELGIVDIRVVGPTELTSADSPATNAWAAKQQRQKHRRSGGRKPGAD